MLNTHCTIRNNIYQIIFAAKKMAKVIFMTQVVDMVIKK